MFPISRPEEVGLCGVRLASLTQWLQSEVAENRLPGGSLLLARRGRMAFYTQAGMADQELERAYDPQTIVRIYSMTKPITSVAAMMLYEQGRFQLDDPVSKFLPSFAKLRVWQGGNSELTQTSEIDSPMTVRHLLTHTAGLTYGFMRSNVLDAEYRRRKIELPTNASDLAAWVDEVADLPLMFQPGSRWAYSIATDVVGHLVELWANQPFAEFLRSQIFEPLGMLDTGFHVVHDQQHRFAALYRPRVGGRLGEIARLPDPVEQAARGGLKLLEGSQQSPFLQPTTLPSGGGGLTSTMGDYARFCQMLLNHGELDGQRLLGPRTVRYMTRNHLPLNCDLAAMGQPVWSETSYAGIGFGLGMAVVLDPVETQVISSQGEYHWGGAASTHFWIDPLEELYVIFFTQLMPSSTYPIRRELRTRVYQAIID